VRLLAARGHPLPGRRAEVIAIGIHVLLPALHPRAREAKAPRRERIEAHPETAGADAEGGHLAIPSASSISRRSSMPPFSVMMGRAR